MTKQLVSPDFCESISGMMDSCRLIANVLLWDFITKQVSRPKNAYRVLHVWTYSLLRATIGDSLDAFHAGYMPAITLRPTEIPQTVARSVGRKTGDTFGGPVPASPSFCPPDELMPAVNTYPPAIPASNPELAPRIPIIRASAMKRLSILPLCAPMAFIVPISLVLSITEVYKVVMIPTAPTRRATSAIPSMKTVNPPVNSLIVASMASGDVTPISFPYIFLISSSTMLTYSPDSAATKKPSYLPDLCIRALPASSLNTTALSIVGLPAGFIIPLTTKLLDSSCWLPFSSTNVYVALIV